MAEFSPAAYNGGMAKTLSKYGDCAKMLSIRVPEELIIKWKAAAGKRGDPLSEWIRDSCERRRMTRSQLRAQARKLRRAKARLAARGS